jgi:parallel beta-helix repeat protein
VKAKAFKNGYNPSAEANASLTVTQPFSFSLTNSGDKSVAGGSSVSNTISATLISGSSQPVSFSVSGLPSGTTGSFSSASCNPACSTVLTISTSGTTPGGNFPITVTSTGGGVTRTTAFTLSVTFALTVATPTITPNGGNFSGSASVTMQTATSGASIYYTMDGSTPTQSSSPYSGALTLTSSVTVNAKAFKSGYNPSALASASFASAGTGNTYYVATTGTDSNSCGQAQSSSAPKRTINAGISCLASGDTLMIKAGTYTDSLQDANIPGGADWGSPTIIRNFGTDAVRIKPTTGIFVLSLSSANQHHIEFNGLIFDGSDPAMTNTVVKITWSGASETNYAHHIRFRNCEFLSRPDPNQSGHYVGNGILGGAGPNGDGLELIGNNFHNVEYALYWGGANALVERNWLHDGAGYGFHFYSQSTNAIDNTIVRYNRIENWGTSLQCSAAILFSHGNNQEAYNNIITGQGGPCGTGIQLDYGANGPKIYNNTIYRNNGPGVSIGSGSTSAVVKNNIVFSNGSTMIDLGSGTVKSNNFTSDPSFANAGGGDFHLQSSSAAIDTGTVLTEVSNDMDGIPRPQGTTWDPGAYEYR